MMRSRMTWILFLILYIKYSTGQEIEVRNNSDGCVLAAPYITYSKEGNSIVLPDDITGAIQDGEYLQVGYTKTFGVFQYIGCTGSGYVPGSVIKHNVHSDPGQCYSACRTEYFAIYETDCYCLETHLSHTGVYCYRECSFPEHTSCGGNDMWGNHYVSLYKYVRSEDTASDDGRLCRAYNTMAAKFEWGNCGFRLPGLCQSDTRYYAADGFWSWTRYVNKCPRLTTYPASENKSRIGEPNQWVIWIGRIRSWVITHDHRFDHEDKYLNYKGYVTMENGQFLLKFSNDHYRIFPKHLCLKGRVPETSTELSSTIPTTSSSKSSLATRISLPVSSSTPPLSTTTSIKRNNETQHDYQAKHAQQNCKEIIAVYVMVPVCIIVCVIVLVLFLISRRRSKAKGDTQNHANTAAFASSQSNTSSNVNNGMQNRAYEGNADSKMKPLADPSSIYSVVNNKSKNRIMKAIPQDKDKTTTTASNYSIVNKKPKPRATENVIDDAYDTTATYTDNKTPNPKHGDDNAYNQLCEDEYGDDVYDQTGCVKPQTGFASDDDTYNHVGKDTDLDYSYNTLGGTVTSHTATCDSDNMYDHATR